MKDSTKKTISPDKNMKIDHKGKKMEQGGDFVKPSEFTDLVGPGRATKKDPSHKSRPMNGGPYSPLGQGNEQGQSMAQPEPDKLQLTKVKN